MADSDSIAFAVIGCGMLARRQHIPNLLRSSRARLHTCCDTSQEALAECQQSFGVANLTTDFRAAIRDPAVQAVCLATTERLRLPVIEEAARCGKHVYVEKPLARTLDEMYRIRDVVRASGIHLCVGHNRRSSPALIEAQRIFRSHMDNPVPSPWRYERDPANRPHLPESAAAGMSVRVNDDWYTWKTWVFDKAQAPHGAMLFEMTHFTDICNWFLADEPQEVVALESGMLNHGVVIRYASGHVATISMCATGTMAYPKELYEAMGNGGMVAVDHLVEVRTAGIQGAPPVITFPMLDDRHPEIGSEGGISGWLAKRRAACLEAERAGDPSLQFAAEPDKGHARALDRFVDEITGRGPEVCGVDAAVLATRVAFAAIRSAAQGRAVRVAEV